MDASPVIVVLAAGLGSRFSGTRHKLAQPLGSSTVLGLTIGHAIESGLQVLVVTTRPLLSEVAGIVAGRDVVLLSGPQQGANEFGMGSSIAAGVAARPEAQGWLVLPGDMPLVKPSSLRAVAAALSHHPVVFAQHQGRRGHPVGFSAELYSDLIQLTGDEGARRIVARYPSLGLEVGDPGVLVDVDTEADLLAARTGVGDAVGGSAS